VPGTRERLRDEEEQDDGADCPRGVRVADAHRRVEEALHRSSIGAATDVGEALDGRRSPKHDRAMADDAVTLKPVDRAEVTIVMDNFVDILLAPAEGVSRYAQDDLGGSRQLVAEHGFSALVTIERDGHRSSVLYDAGLTPDGLARNLDVLEVAVKRHPSRSVARAQGRPTDGSRAPSAPAESSRPRG
jgi:hypothetical protein